MSQIDRDALIEHIDAHCGVCGEARHCVMTAPTIDPVKHAWWVDFRAHDKDWLRDDGKTVFMECSECHEKLCRNLMLSVNYCPSCGAKMDKEETV